jgi:hypothetical protein
MKAKKTKLTAATLSAFLAFGTAVLADAGKNEGTQTGGDKSNSSVKGGKKARRHHRRHHKGGKKSKKGSGSTTPPPK